MAKAIVTIVLDPKTGATLTDIESTDDGDCNRARRVLEAVNALFGIKAEDVQEDDPGVKQVEAALVPKRVRN